MEPPLPRLRLKPNADPRPILRGHPWVWGDQIVWDRRSRKIPTGALAILEGADRGPLALVTAAPEAKVAARVLDRDPDATLDTDWLRARIMRAAALRTRLYDNPFYRLVNAEGDALPGLIIDRFGDCAVVQPNATWIDDRLEALVAVLGELGISHVLKNASGRARALEGLDDASAVLAGSPPDRLNVKMNGATYIADLAGGQKTGLFYDQRPTHAFAARLAGTGRVLDVFSHVGGFALAALAQGASSALAVDASEAALQLATDGAEASGFADRFTTRRGDAFATLEALATEGTCFDLVICDPPAFAPSKSALTQGLRAYERVARLAAPLVAPGGALVLCSCSHAATLEKFRGACLRGIGRAERQPSLIYTGFAGPDHPVHPALSDTGYLKALAFHLP